MAVSECVYHVGTDCAQTFAEFVDDTSLRSQSDHEQYYHALFTQQLESCAT